MQKKETYRVVFVSGAVETVHLDPQEAAIAAAAFKSCWDRGGAVKLLLVGNDAVFYLPHVAAIIKTRRE